MRYRFDDCELDTGSVQLSVDGQRRAVEPQVYDVLVYLVEHRDRVVTKEELLDEVWGHRFVTESALTSRIKSARQAVGDDGKAQRLIRTVHGKGYQFVADVAQSEPRDSGVRGGPRFTPLPAPATPLVGRDADVDAVLALMCSARLVSLLGPGGVGKTRLAIEVAKRSADRFDGRVCFVDLTKVRDAELVAGLIAAELGVRAVESADVHDVLFEAVRGHSLLLVLDNVEHVIDAANLVAQLCSTSPSLSVLATSRERLGVSGEHLFDVAPLTLETSSGLPGDAIELFEQVARAADASFDLDDAGTLNDVVAICRAVDGLPLGIELAAAQVRTLPPALLRVRLDRGPEAPGPTSRDRPARHQTIRSTIDWSLAMLTRGERALYVRMGVFTGAIPLDAIEAVCEGPPVGDLLDTLARLVDKSLVRRVSGPTGGTRFTMLELVRERASELLHASDEAPEVVGRHIRWIIDGLVQLEERRWTVESAGWIDAINERLGEIRTARAVSIERGDMEAVAVITGALGTFWHREGHHDEGRRWTAEVLAYEDTLEPLTAARVRLAAGFIEFAHAEPTARDHWERALALFREVDRPRYVAYTLGMVAGTHIGDDATYDQAMAWCDEALAIARTIGERPLLAQLLNIRGELARVNGDDDTALVAYEEGRSLAEAAGDRSHLSVFLANLAYIATHKGDFVEAHRLGTEALRTCWGLGRRMMAAWTLGELAGPELGLGRPERAARLQGACQEALRVLGAALHLGDRPEHERIRAELRRTLEPERFDELLAEGRRLTLAQAVELALSEP